METSGNSEFSDSKNAPYSLSFWQNFFVTLFGAVGLISMIVEGPRWITYPALVIVVLILLRITIYGQKKSGHKTDHV